jgi:uncharacterized protein
MNEQTMSQGYARGNTVELIGTQKRVMNQVFLWMSLGLALSGAVAWFTAGSTELKNIIFGNRLVFFGLIIAELALVWIISGLINRMSATLATALFFFYAALNGLTLASIFLVYTLGSIAGIFFITAGTFGAMSLYGLTTKKDLTSWGSILFMALIGIIIASVVNIFLQNNMFGLIISAIGVIVFVGLTAYDSQKIKEMAAMTQDGESEAKVATLGALTLYLDFINLFLMLLRLFGGRSDD